MTQRNYRTNPELTTYPWVESPFFEDILNEFILNGSITEQEVEIAIKFNRDGYIVVDLELEHSFIKECIEQIDFLNNRDDIKTQEGKYHYSKGKRIFEGWRESEHLHTLAMNKKVFAMLRFLYRKEPVPFQTITFNYGSNQPLHSDVIHFDSVPHRWLTAVWVALEDMTESNGSLVYVPKSHKLPRFDFYDLKIDVPEYGKQFESYNEYENFIRQLVESSNLKTESLLCKKGQALVWAANLIHGGDIIRDTNSTRYSQVSHYYYEDCDIYFSPMFSESQKGIFKQKDLTTKNIKGHKF